MMTERLYDSMVEHLDELRSEKVKSFDVTETTIDEFLAEWKPSKWLHSTDNTRQSLITITIKKNIAYYEMSIIGVTDIRIIVYIVLYDKLLP
jgi:hypothetical protein